MAYRIVVDGELSARYSVAFEGMKVHAAGGRTIIEGVVPDQVHLHGILDRINGLGLRLLSVETLPADTHDDRPTVPNERIES